jgi:hypothetical protein
MQTGDAVALSHGRPRAPWADASVSGPLSPNGPLERHRQARCLFIFPNSARGPE